MEDNKKPTKFSQLYCKPEQLLEDGNFFRERIVKLYNNTFSEQYKFCELITGETGVSTYVNGVGFSLLAIKNSKTCPTTKFLDIITVGCQALSNNKITKQNYVAGVARILQEEHMNYCISENGELSLFIDEEFQNAKLLTLARLEEKGSENAIQCYKSAHDRLKPGNSYDPKAAIRNVFECLENIVKNITGEGQLSDKAIEKLQEPLLQHYGDKGNKKGFITKTIHSIKDMVQATHNFRHADKDEGIFEPTIDEAACVLSIFSSYIRWILPIAKKSWI